MDINPINMKRIYQSIVEQFVELIKEGKLKIGEKLPPERTLAKMFKVSRASIREAFSAMEIIGLIEVHPGEGTFVRNLNIAPFINTIAPLFVRNESMEDELLEFRKMLELEAVKLAAGKAGSSHISVMEEPIDLMRVAIEKNDTIMGIEADIQFHKTLFSLSNNYILSKSAECISCLLESSVKFNREKILKYSENYRLLYEQHIQIYEAIKNSDVQCAIETMGNHLDFVKRIY
ncbi:MAG: FadR/GntR family transcriptional regulator [Acetivibrionales bacterium]